MNYKMLLPSYRSRYRALMQALQELDTENQLPTNGLFLNLGCGEGDFDRDLLRYFDTGYGCDINEGDISFCRQTSLGLPLHYSVADGEKLPYADSTFDCIVCIDVIEHVPRSEAVIRESYRILKPDGYAIFSFPRQSFPVLYDPINSILRAFGCKLPIGAYAYGHEKLIRDEDFHRWALTSGYKILWERRICGELVGAAECYWPGLLQKLLKQNAGNASHPMNSCKQGVRPAGDTPRLVQATDAFIALDKIVTGWLPTSIGEISLLHKIVTTTR